MHRFAATFQRMDYLRKQDELDSVGDCRGLIRCLVDEARPPVQLVFALRFAATASLARHPSVESGVGLLGWLALTTAIYLVNGLSDLQGDRLNGSSRPLATGHLNATTTWSAVVTLSGAGLLAAASISWTFLALASAMLALGLGYSIGPCWKQRPVSAGLTIGAGAGLTYVAGWCASEGVTAAGIGFVVALSAWTAAASATKDFSDVQGDRLAGRRTLPVLLGAARAAVWVVGAVIVATVGLILVALAARTHIVGSVVIAIGSIMIPLGFRASRRAADRGVARKPYRAYMSTQYASTLAMMTVGA